MKEDFPQYICNSTWRNKSITFPDYRRILHLIQNSLGNTKVSPDVLHYLYLLASASKKYYSNKVPDNIVTMNSQVILQYENKQEQTIRIVYPEDIKSSNDKSIYSPVGTACLGATEKSFIYYKDDSRYNRAYNKKLVFQPEKEKIFHL